MSKPTATYVIGNPDPRREGGELRVTVKILDTRISFGRTDALITPVKGSGEMWVHLNTLEDLSLDRFGLVLPHNPKEEDVT